MNWYKAEIPNEVVDFAYHKAKFFKNDINLKPDWVSKPAENTEFHIVRNKKDILVVIGESWTYGESLPDIATGLGQYSLQSQINHCFGPKLALTLGTDFYQYAVPGNCNFYMFDSVKRILKYLTENYSYRNIKLCIQITEPSRESPIKQKLTGDYVKIYDMNTVKSFAEWLSRYDDIFLTELEKTVSSYNNVEVMVWKNFCKFQNTNDYKNFKIVEDSWLNFSGKIQGINLDMQSFHSVGWFDEFYNTYSNVIKFDKSLINDELDKIENSNNFLKANYLHNVHPNNIAHSLWAYKLYNEYTK